MLKSLSRRLCHAALGLAAIACLAPSSSSQTDHINLEEGLPTQLEDAYPTAYRNREDIVRQQERRRGENSNIIEVGIRRQISPLVVLSVGAGAGVGDQSPKFLITIGIQRTLIY